MKKIHRIIVAALSICMVASVSAAPPGAEHRLQGAASGGFSSRAPERRLSRCGARAWLLLGVSLDPGLNPCFVHWQAESLPWTREAPRSLSYCFH